MIPRATALWAAKARAPLAVVLAGGYARHTDDTVEIHCNTVRVAVVRT